MQRRHYLAAAGSTLTIAVAGCSSSNGDGEDGSDGGSDGGTGDGGSGDGSDGGSDDGSDGSGSDGGSDDPTEEPTDEEGTEIEQRGDIEDLRAELEERDIEIYDLFRDGSDVVLDYLTQAESETDEQLDEEVGAISRAFAAVIEDFDRGLEVMECLALVNEGEFLDAFEVQAEWAREYAAGDLSEEEYTQNVLDTLEYR